MSKQTAVGWLTKELLKNGYVNKGYHSQDSLNHLENLFQQAKEMEREQIEDSYDEGLEEGIVHKYSAKTGNYYYCEIYK